MADSGYSIEKYRPEYRDRVLELQRHLWSPSKALNAAYFEWKYERNPYLDAPVVYLVLQDGNVVAFRGFFGVKWEIGSPSRTAVGLCAEDLVISPEHRNRGLITLIMKAALRDLHESGYSHVYSLSAGAVTFLASLAMGWRNAGSMEPMRRQAGPIPASLRLRRAVIGHHRFKRYSDRFPFRHWAERHRPLIRLDRNLSRVRDRAGRCLSVRQTPRPGEMADLVARIGNRGRIRHVRDEAYFAWRFRNPLSRYRFLYWDENGLQGYLVLQEYVSQYMSSTQVNIADWESTRPDVGAGLLRTAADLCDCEEMVIWTCTLDDGARDLLRQEGFRPDDTSRGMTQHQHCLLVRPTGDGTAESEWRISDIRLADISSWDIRMLFSSMG